MLKSIEKDGSPIRLMVGKLLRYVQSVRQNGATEKRQYFAAHKARSGGSMRSRMIHKDTTKRTG